MAANKFQPRKLLLRALPWAITAGCFAWVYRRIAAEAAQKGQNPAAYLAQTFAEVDWLLWLAWMAPYSVFYLLVDTAMLWRAINWFNARMPLPSLLPIRASSYIISLVNEQVGKGAIAFFLHRTRGVPGWQVASSLLFIMCCEVLYLIWWAYAGWFAAGEALPRPVQAGLTGLPWLALGAACFLGALILLFRSARVAKLLPKPLAALRARNIFHAFRRAHLGHYAGLVALRSPALVASFFVYAECARLFGLNISLLQMVGLLPVVFASTFIPGPFRAGAVLLWSAIFADQNPAQVAAFAFVQHNFFLVFNAVMGLIFVRRANRELFGPEAAAD